MPTNIETVQEIYAAFGRSDVPAILDRLADNVQWESWTDHAGQRHGEVPWFKKREGKAGAAEFFQVVARMNIREFAVLSIMSGGNQVAAEIAIEAATPGGGHYRDEEMHLWTFDEAGKVTRLRHYLDTVKHIEAGRKWQA